MNESDVRDIVLEVADLPATVSDTDPLINFGVDSVTFVNIVVTISTRLGVTFSPHQISRDSFVSISAIARTVREAELGR